MFVVNNVHSSIKTYPGRLLTAQEFSIMMDRMPVIRSGIISGCSIVYSNSVFVVGSGWAVVRGRLVKIDNGSFQIPSSPTGIWSVVVHVGLGIEVEPSRIECYPPTESFADTDDFNTSNSGNAYCILATIDNTNAASPVIKQNFWPERGVESAVVLNKNNWSNSLYTIQDVLVTETSEQRIIPDASIITPAQLTALQFANILGYSQTNGSLTIKAFGVVPTIDIPIKIKYYGG